MDNFIQAQKTYSFEEILKTRGVAVYTCVGCSMLPFLRHRKDIVEIRPVSKKPRKYDIVLYKQGDVYILHRILEVRTNDYVLCGDHNIWREYGITDSQILGVVTRVVRDGKTVTPNDKWYRCYVHLWCDFYYIRAAILYIKMKGRSVKYKLKKFCFEKTSKDG